MNGQLKINSENILPIIKQWLYTDKEIFLRELVSNACDAITKFNLIEPGQEHRIDIAIDTTAKTITISDSGLGMTSEEIESYIAQVAFSGAQAFVEQYKDKGAGEAIIGHFGLGFYSAFMVSDTVTINSLSYKEGSTPAFWSCDGSIHYEMKEGSRESRGTEITLHLNKESEELLSQEKLRTILLRYCRFLPHPIYLGGKRINDVEPLWLKTPSQCTDEEYLHFYHTLYPLDPDPIFWIHLNVDYPFHLQAILYFPKITKHFDMQRSTVHLYSNRVFVSDNSKELLPEFLTLLRGIVDSPDIPLNVSRSTLQLDRTVRQVASHITKKVADKLISLSDEAFQKTWPEIELIIKLGLLQDDKFYERLASRLLFKTASGTWVPLDTSKEQIFYTTKATSSPALLDLYKSKGFEVLVLDSYLDTPLLSLLESKNPSLKFQRIDGALNEALLDGKEEAPSTSISERLSSLLGLEGVKVEAKSLASPTLPAFVVFEERSRRLRDTLSISSQELPSHLLASPTLVVNTNSPLIQAIFAMEDTHLAKGLTEQVYQLALFNQHELPPEQLSSFLSKTTQLLEKLATR